MASQPISIPSNTTVIPINVSSTSKTFTLPVISTNAGRVLILKDLYGNSANSTIKLSTIGVDRIERDGVSSMTLSQPFGAWTFMNDGISKWFLTDVYKNSFPIQLQRGNEIPKSVATLSLWLDATDPTNGGAIPSNNTVISIWYDKSGLGNNLTGYSNPTFLTSPYRMSNFSGAYFYATSPNSYLMTLFIVYYDNNNDGCAPVYTENPNADATGLFANCGGTTFLQTSGGWATQGSSIPKNTQNLLVIQYTSSNGYIWLNGTLNFSVGTGSFTRTGTSFAKRGGNYMNGYYYEIIFYSSVITTTDRQRIEGYLAWKWGLQANLPVGHPYKSSAP